MSGRSHRRVHDAPRIRYTAPRPAPGHLELLRRFLNTAGYEDGRQTRRDRLATRQDGESWLVRQGLLPAGRELTKADLQRLRDLRAALAALAGGEVAAAAGAREELQELLGETRFELDLRGPGKPQIRALGAGVDHAVALLVWSYAEASRASRWPRLKVCGNCGRAFYDHSRNRTGKWCTSVCGERARSRMHQRRKRRKEERIAREREAAAFRERLRARDGSAVDAGTSGASKTGRGG